MWAASLEAISLHSKQQPKQPWCSAYLWGLQQRWLCWRHQLTGLTHRWTTSLDQQQHDDVLELQQQFCYWRTTIECHEDQCKLSMPQTHYIFLQSLAPQPTVWALGGRSSSGEHRWSLAKNPAWQESWDNSLPWLPDCCCCCHDLLLLQGSLSSLDIPLHSGGLPHCKVWSPASHHTETLLPSRKLLILLECREA